MAAYKLTTHGNSVIRTSDGAHIPADPTNTDYQAYIQWDSIPGNTPDPADPLPTKKYDDRINVQEVQTTNATPTAINFPLNSGTLYVSDIVIVGIQDISPFNSATFRKFASVGRAGGGAILIGQGDAHTPFKSAGASAWTAVLSVSGNNGIVTVTGAAGVTINWTIRSTYFRLNKDGLVD